MKRFFYRLAAVTVSMGTLATPVAAQKPSDYFDPRGSLVDSGLPQTPVVDYVLQAVAVFLSVIGIITLVLVIYAGFMILISAGNEDRVQKGRDILIWAVIGLIIVLGSLGITLFLNRLVA